MIERDPTSGTIVRDRRGQYMHKSTFGTTEPTALTTAQTATLHPSAHLCTLVDGRRFYLVDVRVDIPQCQVVDGVQLTSTIHLIEGAAACTAPGYVRRASDADSGEGAVPQTQGHGQVSARIHRGSRGPSPPDTPPGSRGPSPMPALVPATDDDTDPDEGSPVAVAAGVPLAEIRTLQTYAVRKLAI